MPPGASILMKEKTLRKIFFGLLPALIILSLKTGATEAYFGLAIFNPEDIYDETFLAFDNNAADSVDQFDAPKLTGLSGISVYTKIGAGDFSVQVMPQLTEDKTITIGIDADMPGTHLLRLMYLEDLDESVAIILEDTYTGVFVNMRKQQDYWFNLAAGTGMERFRLHVNPAIIINTVDGTCDGVESRLEMRQDGSYSWNYEVKDGNDSIIDAGTSWNGTRSLTELPTGTYKITFEDQYGYSVEKTALVTDKEAVVAQFQISDSITAVNRTVYFFDYSIGATDYVWDFGDGNILSGTPYPANTFAHPGSYEVKFTVANEDDCTDFSSKIIEVVGYATGIHDADGNVSRIYSYEENIFIDFPQSSGIARVAIYNALGQRIYHATLNASGRQSIAMPESCGFCLVELVHDGKYFEAKVTGQ